MCFREGKWSPGSPITQSTLLNRAASGWRGAMYKAEYREIDYNVTTCRQRGNSTFLHGCAWYRYLVAPMKQLTSGGDSLCIRNSGMSGAQPECCKSIQPKDILSISRQLPARWRGGFES